MIFRQFVISLSLLSLFLAPNMHAAGDTGQEGSISLQDLRCYCSHLSTETPIMFQQITDFTSADWGRVAAMLHGSRAQQLYFCGSYIGDEGATNIAAMVGNMPYLTHLSLQKTGISTVGLVEICDALNNRVHNEKYPFLYLDIRGNGLTTLASIKSLISLPNGNPNFTIVNEFFDKDTLSEIIKKMRVQNRSNPELSGATLCAPTAGEPIVDNSCGATPRSGDRRGGLRGLFGLGNSQQNIGDGK